MKEAEGAPEMTGKPRECVLLEADKEHVSWKELVTCIKLPTEEVRGALRVFVN